MVLVSQALEASFPGTLPGRYQKAEAQEAETKKETKADVVKDAAENGAAAGRWLKVTIGKIYKQKYKSYQWGAVSDLNAGILDNLIRLFTSEPKTHVDTLEGRGPALYAIISGLGHVVVKSYKRGGVLSWFNKEYYLKTGEVRSKKEFEFLVAAAKAGVSVSKPIAYASRGSGVYKAWLITEAIESHVSFARLSRDEKEKALALMPSIVENIKRLIQNKIHHVDLHPGNILIDKYGRNYIIDFDKAYYFTGSRDKLGGLYQKRWNKAVYKHRLPEVLTSLPLVQRNP